MKKIAAGEFKAHCLAVMDDVYQTGETVLITKRGKPVVKLVPVPRKRDDFFDTMKDIVKIHGDVMEPVDPPDAWDCEK